MGKGDGVNTKQCNPRNPTRTPTDCGGVMPGLRVAPARGSLALASFPTSSTFSVQLRSSSRPGEAVDSRYREWRSEHGCQGRPGQTLFPPHRCICAVVPLFNTPFCNTAARTHIPGFSAMAMAHGSAPRTWAARCLVSASTSPGPLWQQTRPLQQPRICR